MSLINEKDYDVYDYKPSEVNDIIDKKHTEYDDAQKELKSFCPTCKSSKYSFAFDKYSFHYVQCQECMTLYIQNPLLKEDISKYEDYMQKELYNSSRYDKYLDILMDKTYTELELTFLRLLDKKRALKVGYVGNKSKIYKHSLKSFEVEFIDIDLSKNEQDEQYDLIILDHVIEKSTYLDGFMQKVNLSLTDNGFVYITMRVGSGIDILTLWEDSKLYPIEHTNLLSIDGIKILFDRNSLSVKELNTPGVLDIDNILKTKSQNIPRFLEYLLKSDKNGAIEEFQAFAQKNLLSSFATIVAQRK